MIASVRSERATSQPAVHFCRICQSREVVALGEVEYYSGFAWPICDCAECGCRFTKHQDEIYDWLHQQPNSLYGIYRELADTARESFKKRDLAQLRSHLVRTPKYKFIIESVEQRPNGSRLLEVGCSRGHLTAYFILAGYDILGMDVSSEAIDAAKADFGERFVTADSPLLRQKAPYDIIYHTGMIGCVADPIKTTSELLELLKPGGCLLFNAPNRDACALKDQLWIDASAPPDVVTLFPPRFWKIQFSDVAQVDEAIAMLPREHSFGIGLRRAFGLRWRKPQPIALESSVNNYKGARPESPRVWHKFERVMTRAASTTGLARLAPAQPDPFGIFVKMIRK